MSALFKPFSITTGLLAGLAATKLFEKLWSKVAHEEAPDPKIRETEWRKLIAALLVEGAIMRVVRGATDRATRVAFTKLTGSWPGEQRPAPE